LTTDAEATESTADSGITGASGLATNVEAESTDKGAISMAWASSRGPTRDAGGS
jgi:hypothetical protein